MMAKVLQKALCVTGLSMMVGCGAGGLLPRSTPPAQTVEVEPIGLSLYLDTQETLVEGDLVAQAEVFADAERDFEWAPTTTNRLRLALALATPGHASTDSAAAQRMLNELLASPASLLPLELTLARIHLKEVEARLILAAENRRVQQDAASDAARRETTSQAQLDASLAETRRLRQALAEAESKLEAITSIERSIRERSNGDGTL